MADLTPVTIPELPAASSLGDNDLFPFSQNNATKKIPWSLIDSKVAARISGQCPFKIYNSVTQLGLTSGSATIADALAALSQTTYQMLICYAGNFAASEVPSTIGNVMIWLTGSARPVIEFFGRAQATGDFRMFTDSYNVPSGVWVPSDGVIYKEHTVTLAANANVSPFSYYGGKNITPPAGLTIVSATGVGASAGVILPQIGTGGTSVYVYGHSAGDVTIRVGFGIIRT